VNLAWSDDPERAELDDLMDALQAGTSDPATAVIALRARVDRVDARARALLQRRCNRLGGLHQVPPEGHADRRHLPGAARPGDPAFVARAAKTREAVGVATDKTLRAQTSADPELIAEAVQSLRQAFWLASD
jgi:hypothetical protein